MAAVLSELAKAYNFLNNDLADPRTKDLFMIGTPWPLLTVIGLYLYFIFDLGPKFMERRQPFKLDKLLQIYDLSQILMNTYLLYIALDLAWLRDYSFICQPVDFSYSPRAIKITRVVWLYFLNKLMDLLDTVFFVLRKKKSQISFLHVYHHTGMAFGGWTATKYLAGGHVTFLGVINTFVHVIMYTHYFLSSMKVNTSAWKKHITQLQLLQFFLIVLHYVQLLWVEDCGFPMWPVAVMVPQNFFMMILFGEFYYNTYVKKNPADRAKPTKTEANGVSTEIQNGKLKEQ